MLLLSFTVFFTGRDLLGLPLAQLQTLVFVMLVATGQGNVYLVRERGHFWQSRPSRWLVWQLDRRSRRRGVDGDEGRSDDAGQPAADCRAAGWGCAYLLVLDQLKVLIFRRLEIH